VCDAIGKALEFLDCFTKLGSARLDFVFQVGFFFFQFRLGLQPIQGYGYVT